MASEEIAAVVELLRANNPMAGETIEEMRATMKAASEVAPLPDDVRFEPTEIAGIAAEWTEAPGVDPDRAVLYLHGGGYTIGGIESHRQVVAGLSRAANLRVLSLGYRLAPEAPFPAAVEDAVAATSALVEQGFAPSRLALAGDSAGGGLTAATLISLRDAGGPLPAAGVCISPWLDLSQSLPSYASKRDADPIVSKEMLDLMSAAYLDGRDASDPLASPIHAELAGLPPLLIQVGTAEVLLDDSLVFAERAGAAGVEVELEVWDDMIHVWHAFSLLIPEGEQAITRIGEYLGEKLS